MTVKQVLVTNRTIGWVGLTRAATYLGYHNAAKRIWPHPGKFEGWIRVTDTKTSEIVFEEEISFTKGETA